MAPRVVVVGLGPGDPTLVTEQTRRAIASTKPRYLRTSIHPSAHLVLDAPGGAESFDHRYDDADSFDDVYRSIVEDLVDAASEHGQVLYAVPGSPLILERTVARLRTDPRIETTILPAVSFLDDVWRALNIDPVESSVQLIDGHDFARAAAGLQGPLLVAHTHANWVLNDMKLSIDDPAPDTLVVLLHHIGLPDERIVTTTWADMDRTLEADHLTSLFIPRLTTPVGSELIAFHALARTLREQCPWDREQSHQTLVRYLLEEAYEVVDAIDKLDPDDPTTDVDFIEELGDLLYQIEFHATIAEQEGRFTMADVARSVHDKLVSRHPHVFGDATAHDAEQALQSWEDIKQAEKPHRVGPFDGVIEAAPSLAFANKVQSRAARIGFDWPSIDGALDKITEETDEVRTAISANDLDSVTGEIGDLLFSIVNVARHLDIDPETALRRAVLKFRQRVLDVQELATEQGREMGLMSLEELDRLWEMVKARRAG